MSEHTLVIESLEDIAKRDDDELLATGLRTLMARHNEALNALQRQRGEEIGVYPFDWTYHGCDPVWQEVYATAWDLTRLMALRER